MIMVTVMMVGIGKNKARRKSHQRRSIKRRIIKRERGKEREIIVAVIVLVQMEVRTILQMMMIERGETKVTTKSWLEMHHMMRRMDTERRRRRGKVPNIPLMEVVLLVLVVVIEREAKRARVVVRRSIDLAPSARDDSLGDKVKSRYQCYQQIYSLHLQSYDTIGI